MKSLMGTTSNNDAGMQGLANNLCEGNIEVLANRINEFLVSGSSNLPRLTNDLAVFDVQDEIPAEYVILTTNLAECVCVCVSAKCDPFQPLRSHFFFKLPEFFFRIAKFPYAAFGPLFAFHCPIFFTKNNTLNGVCMLNVTAAH